jgi:hypothetical protein
MVQTAETGKGDNVAEFGRLNRAMSGRVLAKGEVHSVLVVPVAEFGEQALGVPFVQHDQVVETLAAEGADHPLCEGVHPWRPHRGADLADAEAPHSGREGKPVGSIVVADEEPRWAAPGEGESQGVRDTRRLATSLEFGPRFLHSTGQACKGGPNTGVFLQITCDDAVDVPVPGRKYTFGVVKAAQARRDVEVLVERDRRALRVHLGADVAAGLSTLQAAFLASLRS